MRIGLHRSTKGGLAATLRAAHADELPVVQVFLGSPRTWRVSGLYDDDAAAEIRALGDPAGVEWYVHLPYLINVASPEPKQYERSTDALIDYCTAAETLGAAGVVLHVGSHRGAGFAAVLDQMVRSFDKAAVRLSSSCRLLLENAAGQGHAIGSSLDELARLVDAVGSERLAICLDTAHLMGAGVEFRDHESLSRLLATFDAGIGLERLALVHLNDSQRGLGSGRDLHENLGFGSIGVDGFAPLLTCAAVADVPAVLEVPGLDGNGPDAANLALARDIASGGRPRIERAVDDQLSLGL